MHKEWVSLLLILGLWAPVCAQNSLSSVRRLSREGFRSPLHARRNEARRMTNMNGGLTTMMTMVIRQIQ